MISIKSRNIPKDLESKGKSLNLPGEFTSVGLHTGEGNPPQLVPPYMFHLCWRETGKGKRKGH